MYLHLVLLSVTLSLAAYKEITVSDNGYTKKIIGPLICKPLKIDQIAFSSVPSIFGWKLL